jgi:hypothetical protein
LYFISGKAWMSNKVGAPKSSIIPGTNKAMPNYLVGDAAFPLLSNMMRPYTKPRNRNFNDKERIFNYRLSRARRVVENAFGIMASRFRIFRKPIVAHVETLDVIIMASVCLHNFLCTRLPRKTALLGDTENANGIVSPGQWRSAGQVGNLRNVNNVGTSNLACRDAYEVRDELRDYFVSEEGSIDS